MSLPTNKDLKDYLEINKDFNTLEEEFDTILKSGVLSTWDSEKATHKHEMELMSRAARLCLYCDIRDNNISEIENGYYNLVETYTKTPFEFGKEVATHKTKEDFKGLYKAAQTFDDELKSKKGLPSKEDLSKIGINLGGHSFQIST